MQLGSTNMTRDAAIKVDLNLDIANNLSVLFLFTDFNTTLYKLTKRYVYML